MLLRAGDITGILFGILIRDDRDGFEQGRQKRTDNKQDA